MSTTTSRIGAYVPNFTPDNTGRTLMQSYQVITATAGTVNLVPTSQISYFNFTNALAGSTTINVSATYSGISSNGAGTSVYYYNQICDEIVIFLNGGAATQSVTFGNNIASSAASINVPNNVPATIKGYFNGTEFVASSVIATK